MRRSNDPKGRRKEGSAVSNITRRGCITLLGGAAVATITVAATVAGSSDRVTLEFGR